MYITADTASNISDYVDVAHASAILVGRMKRAWRCRKTRHVRLRRLQPGRDGRVTSGDQNLDAYRRGLLFPEAPPPYVRRGGRCAAGLNPYNYARGPCPGAVFLGSLRHVRGQAACKPRG
ncbi:MAG: hypothetical protein MZV63_60480 [Marinilabiliales bacterium]|nr:hypothetical protein [Marinilabiliales bacterium]